MTKSLFLSSLTIATISDAETCASITSEGKGVYGGAGTEGTLVVTVAVRAAWTVGWNAGARLNWGEVLRPSLRAWTCIVWPRGRGWSTCRSTLCQDHRGPQ